MEWKQVFGVLAAGMFILFAVYHGLFAAGHKAGRRVWGREVDSSNGGIRAASALIAIVFVVVALFVVQTSGILDLGLPQTRDILISSVVLWIAVESGTQLLHRRLKGWRARLVIGGILLLVTLPVVVL